MICDLDIDLKGSTLKIYPQYLGASFNHPPDNTIGFLIAISNLLNVILANNLRIFCKSE